jgi:hypothetical protein
VGSVFKEWGLRRALLQESPRQNLDLIRHGLGLTRHGAGPKLGYAAYDKCAPADWISALRRAKLQAEARVKEV